jgi:hypothetical protein
MTPGEYIREVVFGYVNGREKTLTLFNAKDLKRFKPITRLDFLRNYYQWRVKTWNYSCHRHIFREHITEHFYHPKKVYLSVEEVGNLLFSLALDEKYNSGVSEFIKDYKALLIKLRKISKKHIRIKKKIVAAGMWK